MGSTGRKRGAIRPQAKLSPGQFCPPSDHGTLTRWVDHKIHALVDALGRPIRLKLAEGQTHDGRSAADLYARLGLGQTLRADRAYDRDGLRQALAEQGAVANIWLMPTRKRFPAFDAVFYRQRNQVERFFSKLKHFRAVATRYDKRDDNFPERARV